MSRRLDYYFQSSDVVSERRPTVVDLFSGCGGFSEGFAQADFDVILAVDNWQQSLDSHEANHRNTVHKCENILLLKKGWFKNFDADVIIGSPPCQEFSTANENPDLEKGLRLTNKFLELIEELKPKYWVMENVVGVKSFVEGWVHKLGGRCYILNSANYGVAQKRKRLFAGRFPFPRPTHTKKGNTTLTGETLRKWKTIREAFYEIPVDVYTLQDLTLTENAQNKTWEMIGAKEGLVDMLLDYAFEGTINDFDKTCNTLTTQLERVIICRKEQPSRRITINEVKAIMGFPQHYHIKGSRSAKYQQLGNAVCPPVAKAIAEEIKNEEL